MPVFSSFCLRGSALDGSLKVATVTMFITGHYTALIQNQPSRQPVCARFGFVLTTRPGRPSYGCEPGPVQLEKIERPRMKYSSCCWLTAALGILLILNSTRLLTAAEAAA